MKTENKTEYPDTYLHVVECRSGETWIVPIGDNDTINLRDNVEAWVRVQYDGELEIDGSMMPKLDGDYYARIMTDGRPPESVVCWDGGGFYLKTPNAD